MRIVPFVQLLILTLWLGGGLAIMLIGAPAAFAGSPDRSAAAGVVGIMLRRWHYLSLFLPAALLVFEWRHGFAHNARVLFLVAAILLSVSQVAVDARIHSMRASSLTSISELAPTDPYRRHFGMLHGISSLLMLVQLVAAAGVLWTLASPRDTYTPAERPAAREIEL